MLWHSHNAISTSRTEPWTAPGPQQLHRVHPPEVSLGITAASPTQTGLFIKNRAGKVWQNEHPPPSLFSRHDSLPSPLSVWYVQFWAGLTWGTRNFLAKHFTKAQARLTKYIVCSYTLRALIPIVFGVSQTSNLLPRLWRTQWMTAFSAYFCNHPFPRVSSSENHPRT